MTWNILSSMNSSVSRCNANVINIQNIHWPSLINYTIIFKIVINQLIVSLNLTIKRLFQLAQKTKRT